MHTPTSTHLDSMLWRLPQCWGSPTPELRSPYPVLRHGQWPSYHTQGDLTSTIWGDEHAKTKRDIPQNFK